jgi:outer membrane murein-binding lipoprotein Lpp
MADLQDAVRQEAEFREKVEKGKVEEQQLQIQVSIMNDGNDQLYRKKDDLIEQKELLEQKRDQMRKDAAAAEDQANRRMAKKLTSNTNQDYKQKVIALESLENEIQETEKRMMESKAKHDSMLAGRQLIQEQFKRKTEQMEEDKEIIKLQDDKIAELKALIEAQELKASENGLALEKAHRLSNYEEQRSRELIQRESALSAKLEYIEKGYDYKSKVKSVNTEVFRQLMAMNANVRRVKN